jgi:hypothetical protein
LILPGKFRSCAFQFYRFRQSFTSSAVLALCSGAKRSGISNVTLRACEGGRSGDSPGPSHLRTEARRQAGGPAPCAAAAGTRTERTRSSGTTAWLPTGASCPLGLGDDRDPMRYRARKWVPDGVAGDDRKENLMRARRYGIALLLLAVLAWHGPAGGAGATIVRGRQLADNRPPASSACIARCSDAEAECEELVKRFPSCSVVDICFEEKLQCEALCRGISDAIPRRRARLFKASAIVERAQADRAWRWR